MIIEALRLTNQKVLFVVNSEDTDKLGRDCIEYFIQHKPADKKGFMFDADVLIYQKE